jgi:hypothetical protein
VNSFDEFEGDEAAWARSEKDRAVLEKLRSTLLGLRRSARSGADLRALGTALMFIEEALEGVRPDHHSQLSIGFRQGDSYGSEGVWVGFTVYEDEIKLDETRSVYERDVGSDHESFEHAVLYPGKEWNADGVDRWIRRLDELLGEEGARFDGTLNE